MQYRTVVGDPSPALPAVDPNRPPYDQYDDGDHPAGGLADGSHPVIQARLRTAVEQVDDQATRTHRRLVGMLPVPAVLLAAAIVLAQTQPGLAVRLILDAAALSAAGALVAGLLGAAQQHTDPTTGFSRWALFAKAPASAVYADLARTAVGHPASLAGRLVAESVALSRVAYLRHALLIGAAGSTVLLTLAALTA
ncbi:hypothetical protein [Kutzneria chonburiensis]|uniref:Uncharacterized protein n=1 Tax=Kutzneria chonburiensis TaxID=1483604 RepID=A0ABV6MKL9_9PSEU|nr:hypothetical protein [Kutzneria chonburiensis]